MLVEYEELPAVVTIEAATAPGAPQMWPDAPGNIAAQTRFGKKDECDAAFRKAIDNIFKKAAERAKEQAQGAARRGRKARKRVNDAEDRQKRRKSDH